MDNVLLFDIETRKNEKLLDFVPEPEMKAVPSNYKDQEKINAFVAKIEEEHKEAILAQQDKMAKDVDFARICCLGMNTSIDSPEHEIYLCRTPEEEIRALEEFWKIAKYSTIIGYNCIHFDLPIIIRRSMMLNVIPSIKINLGRARYDSNIIDLMLKLYNDGYVTNMNSKKPFSRKQGLICQILGIENPMPGIDGSMVKDMTDQELLNYNANDLMLLQQLVKRCKGYYF